jgi:hypothetical protein
MLPIALCIVLFFDLLIMLLVPSTATLIFVPAGTTAWYVTDFVALFIGLHVLYYNGWKKAPSSWLLAFILFMLISHFHAVNIHFEGAFIPSDLAIFDYKPMFDCLVLFIMFMGIYSMNLNENAIQKIKKTLSWAAIAYAAFAILQRVGLDQLYKGFNNQIGTTPSFSGNLYSYWKDAGSVGAFISQPVFCAAALVILLPFVISTKSWWKIMLVAVAILATGNRGALVAAAIFLLYLFNFKLIWRLALVSYLGFLLLGLASTFINIPIMHYTDVRFHMWHDVISDSFCSMFPGINNSHILTGYGIGSFSILSPYYHVDGRWLQAHNEYLECLKGLGIIGFILLAKFISQIPTRDKTIVASLLAAFVVALTNATWHVPQLAFLTVFLIALLFNMENAYVYPNKRRTGVSAC